MQKIINIVLLAFVILTASLFSQTKKKDTRQWMLSVGMGIDYGSTPSFTDFLKSEIPLGSPDSIHTFSTGVEFFAGVEYGFAKNVSAKLDYSYFIRSNRYTYGQYVFDFNISAHQPFVMVYFKNPDSRFPFKLGAGTGYHLHYLDYVGRRYHAGGISFRGEFIFAPKFSDKLETYIGGFVFGTSGSSLKDDNGILLKAAGSDKEVNLGGYGVGARLGLSFNLN